MLRARRWETPTNGATRRRTLCGGSTCARVQCVMNKIWRRRRKIVLGLFQRWKYRFASEGRKFVYFCCLPASPRILHHHQASAAESANAHTRHSHVILSFYSECQEIGFYRELFSNLPIFQSHIDTLTPSKQLLPVARFPRTKSHPNVNLCSCSCNLHTSSAFLYKILRGKKKNGMT